MAATPESADRSQLDDRAHLIALADGIKTSNHEQFVQLLGRLDSDPNALSDNDQWHLRYLDAWEAAFIGDYDHARPMLQAIIDHSPDQNFRYRATATLINIFGIGRHYEEAFTLVNKVMEEIPQISDKYTRFQVLGESAQLLIEAGQYDLASTYADQILANSPDGKNECEGIFMKTHARYESGRMQAIDPAFQSGVNKCEEANEPLFADGIRIDMARFFIEHGRASDGIAILESTYKDVLGFKYEDLIAETNALLAEAYFNTGDVVRAAYFARAGIATAIKREQTESLSIAYKVLYKINEQQGNLRAALSFHEKFMAAEKGALDEVREKALAYQIVEQEVTAKKVELDELGKQNQILTLHRALDEQSMRNSRLLIALLLTLMASIALWLYRLKRSQLRFMHLARRDGLTGIFNRQYFVEDAERSLRHAAKSLRNVSVILIDLDYFKLINDSHGHAAGDQVLKRTVAVCEKLLKPSDVFGRLGGEEFGIVLPECTLSQAVVRAEEIRTAIAETASTEDIGTLAVTASFGVASSESRGYDLRQLLIGADTALYQAKHDGRNRVVADSSDDNMPSSTQQMHLRIVDDAMHHSSPMVASAH